MPVDLSFRPLVCQSICYSYSVMFFSGCFIHSLRGKFRNQMRQCISSRSTECIGVAYSGGPSSTSLLQLVTQCQDQDPDTGRKMFFQFCAIHVDDTALLPLSQDERRIIVSDIAAAASRSGAGAIRIVKLEDIWQSFAEVETIDAVGAGTIALTKKRDDQARAAAKALQHKADRAAVNAGKEVKKDTTSLVAATPVHRGRKNRHGGHKNEPSTPSSVASTPTSSSTSGRAERKRHDPNAPVVRATPITPEQIEDVIRLTPNTDRLRALFAAIHDSSDKTDLLSILTARAVAHEAKQQYAFSPSRLPPSACVIH
jgi:hypothetical protein